MYFRLAPPGAMPPRWCDFELVSARTGVRAGLGVSVSAFPFFQSVTIQYNTLSLREEGRAVIFSFPPWLNFSLLTRVRPCPCRPTHKRSHRPCSHLASVPFAEHGTPPSLSPHQHHPTRTDLPLACGAAPSSLCCSRPPPWRVRMSIRIAWVGRSLASVRTTQVNPLSQP